MDSPDPRTERSRLARLTLTAVLALLAVRAFLQGKRLRGGLAAIGAVAVGYSTVDSSDMTLVEVERSTHDPDLTCAICGEAIVPGEPRVPNEAGETVHDACLDAS